VAAVGTVLASPPPYLLGKLPALPFGSLVDDFPALIVCAASMFEGGLNVLREVCCAGVKLACPYALASPRHCKAKAGITALAKPSQVLGRAVRFVSVSVIDHKKAG